MGVGVDVMRRGARRGQRHRGKNAREGKTGSEEEGEEEEKERVTKRKRESFQGPAVAGSSTVPHTSGSPAAASARRLSV